MSGYLGWDTDSPNGFYTKITEKEAIGLVGAENTPHNYSYGRLMDNTLVARKGASWYIIDPPTGEWLTSGHKQLWPMDQRSMAQKIVSFLEDDKGIEDKTGGPATGMYKGTYSNFGEPQFGYGTTIWIERGEDGMVEEVREHTPPRPVMRPQH